MKYVRIYATDDGESHFADVEAASEPQSDSWSPAQALRSTPFAVQTAYFRRVAGDDDSGEPHNAPRRQLLINLDGECEVRVSDGETRRFGAGSVILVEDLTGMGHWTRIIGEATGMVVTLPDGATPGDALGAPR